MVSVQHQFKYLWLNIRPAGESHFHKIPNPLFTMLFTADMWFGHATNSFQIIYQYYMQQDWKQNKTENVFRWLYCYEHSHNMSRSIPWNRHHNYDTYRITLLHLNAKYMFFISSKYILHIYFWGGEISVIFLINTKNDI